MRWTLLFACGLAFFPAIASAQPTGTDRAVAAFEEARTLIDGGQCDRALVKLKESLALRPSIGAHLSFADCVEQSAPLEAWQHLKEAARLAYVNHDDRFALAETRAGELAKRLPAVRVELPADALEMSAFELRFDGVRVDPFYYRDGVIATTAGSHVVDASAPNQAWSQQVTTMNASTTTVRVVLRDARPPPPVAPPQPAPSPLPRVLDVDDPGATQRTIGFTIGGAGIGALVIGSLFGAVTLARRSDLQQACGGDLSSCTASSQAIEGTRGAARSSATVATIGLVGGGIAVAAGAVLVFTAPKKRTSTSGQIQIAPSVGLRSVGMTVAHTW